MIGVIGEVSFDLIEEEMNRGHFQSHYGGYITSLMDEEEAREKKNVIFFTKIGRDSLGEEISKDFSLAFPEYSFFFSHSNRPTLVSINSEQYIAESAIGDIKEDELTQFIRNYKLDILVLSGALLSFKPLSDEIERAIIKNKDNIKALFIDISDSFSILLLEELKEKIENIKSEIKTIVIGDTLILDDVKRCSKEKLVELINNDLLEKKS